MCFGPFRVLKWSICDIPSQSSMTLERNSRPQDPFLCIHLFSSWARKWLELLLVPSSVLDVSFITCDIKYLCCTHAGTSCVYIPAHSGSFPHIVCRIYSDLLLCSSVLCHWLKLNYNSVDSSSLSQQCSSTCAGGFQRRVVVCQDENGYPASNCEDRSRPSEQRSCESGPCPQWIYGNWGEVRQATLYVGLQVNHITSEEIRKVLICSASFKTFNFKCMEYTNPFFTLTNTISSQHA